MVTSKILALGVLGAVGMSSVGFAGLANAQSNNRQDSLVDKISSRFNLNKDDVKKVFEEKHEQREAEHEKKFAEKLDQLVKDGKITAEQKSKIEAKFKEIHEQREKSRSENQNLSHQERHEKMETQREELEQWAKDNGINLDLIKPDKSGDKGHRRGHGGPRGDQV